MVALREVRSKERNFVVSPLSGRQIALTRSPAVLQSHDVVRR